MAAPESLKPGSLMDTVKSYLTPETVRSASSLVGESEASTRQTLSGAAAGVLNGLVRMVSTPEGVNNLGGVVRDGGFLHAVDNAGSLFTGGSTTSTMRSAGQQFIRGIFPGTAASVTNLVARSGGVSSPAAGSLFSLVASLILGVLGKTAAAHGLDSNGLANAILSEKSEITAAAPPGLLQLLSGGGPSVVPRPKDAVDATPSDTTKGIREVPPVARSGSWRPLLWIAMAAIVLLFFLRPRGTRSVETGTFGSAQTIHSLAQFLGDNTQAAPRTFVLEDLHFQADSPQLMPNSRQTVDNLAQVLSAFPAAQVQVLAQGDNSGSVEANQALSQDRADAIRVMLADQGIAAERISTKGPGEYRLAAYHDSNDPRLEPHGPDGEDASTLGAMLDRNHAEVSTRDRSVVSTDTEDPRTESHGPDGDDTAGLAAMLNRSRNPRVEVTVVNK